MSRFHEIFLELKQRIKTEEFPVGTLLPSEHKLAHEYGVTRETIRKALSALMDEGFIQKRQGRGSTVLAAHRYHFPMSGLTSFKELKESQGIPARTEVVSNDIVVAPAALVEGGHVGAGELMTRLVRRRFVDGEVFIVDIDYLRFSIVPFVPTERMSDSLFTYLEKDCNLQIAYANKEFSAERMTDEIRELMIETKDTHVILVKSMMYLEDARFFQYTESRHRLDRFEFIEFARRRTIK